jgi:hypothetical protein
VDCCAWIEGDRLLLLQLTQLKQLTSLFYSGPCGCYDTTVRLSDEVSYSGLFPWLPVCIASVRLLLSLQVCQAVHMTCI